jgi:hypothetical protein
MLRSPVLLKNRKFFSVFSSDFHNLPSYTPSSSQQQWELNWIEAKNCKIHQNLIKPADKGKKHQCLSFVWASRNATLLSQLPITTSYSQHG